ncbi:sensor histidine kinase [Neofamilia massiliensis]|uniref:sensor histidine kinase n=1 Tax=Neofamilia massiliensis TaxID=1673724 RepID=UPI0012B7C600|nr:PAS domain-containing sensor histidine kinase [Neofamilia massiliensis]
MKKQMMKTLVVLLLLGIFLSFTVFFFNFYKINYQREIQVNKDLRTYTMSLIEDVDLDERDAILKDLSKNKNSKFFIINSQEDLENILKSIDKDLHLEKYEDFLEKKEPTNLYSKINKESYYLLATNLSEETYLLTLTKTNNLFKNFSESLPYLLIILAIGYFFSYYATEKNIDNLVSVIEDEAMMAGKNEINLDPKYKEIYPLLRIIEDQAKDIDRKIEKLEEQSSTIDSIISKMEEGMILLDQDLKILSINQAAINFSQVSKNDLDFKGLYFFDIFRDRSLKEKILAALGEDDGSFSYEIHQDGKILNLLFSKVEQNDREIGYVILLVDETKEKLLEIQRSEFSANVSHELKTPLTSINGYAEMLMAGLVKEEDTKKFAGIIYEEGKHLLSMIEDIIKISKLDEEKTALEKDNIDLIPLAKKITENLETKAQANKVNTNFIGPDSLFINTNKGLITELITNLYDNGIKYNKENGNLSLEIKDDLKNIFLIFSDTGLGISKEDQARIFERFYTVDKSHNKKDSSGLGLSIVKHIVRILDGDIILKSELGKGSTFTIRLKK